MVGEGKGVARDATAFGVPDVSSIETFLVAANTGSMAKAAAKLNISVSTASRRIERMEHLMGGALFERLYSGLELTALGHRMHPHAQSIKKSLESLVSVAQLDQTVNVRPKRVITIGAPEGIGALWIARFTAAFLEVFPDVVLNFETRSVLGAERKTAPDVIVSVGAPLNGEVIRVPCGGMHFVAYDTAVSAHRMQHYNERLAEHVDYVGTSQWIDPSEEALGNQREFRLRTDSTSFLTTAVRHGAGRALFPNFWHLIVDGLIPVEDSPSGYLPMHLSFNKGFAQQAEGRAVIEWLKRVLKMPPWFGREFLPAASLGDNHLRAADTRIFAAISKLPGGDAQPQKGTPMRATF